MNLDEKLEEALEGIRVAINSSEFWPERASAIRTHLRQLVVHAGVHGVNAAIAAGKNFPGQARKPSWYSPSMAPKASHLLEDRLERLSAEERNEFVALMQKVHVELVQGRSSRIPGYVEEPSTGGEVYLDLGAVTIQVLCYVRLALIRDGGFKEVKIDSSQRSDGSGIYDYSLRMVIA